MEIPIKELRGKPFAKAGTVDMEAMTAEFKKLFIAAVEKAYPEYIIRFKPKEKPAELELKDVPNKDALMEWFGNQVFRLDHGTSVNSSIQDNNGRINALFWTTQINEIAEQVFSGIDYDKFYLEP